MVKLGLKIEVFTKQCVGEGIKSIGHMPDFTFQQIPSGIVGISSLIQQQQ